MGERWERLPEAVRWILYFPVTLLCALAVTGVMYQLAWFSNRFFWGASLAALFGGAILGYFGFRIAHALAPRKKMLLALLAMLPFALLALLTLLNGVVDVLDLRSAVGGEAGNASDGLWGLAWFIATAVGINRAKAPSQGQRP